MKTWAKILVGIPYTVFGYFMWTLIIGLFIALVNWNGSLIFKNVPFWTRPETAGDIAIRVISWIISICAVGGILGEYKEEKKEEEKPIEKYTIEQ